MSMRRLLMKLGNILIRGCIVYEYAYGYGYGYGYEYEYEYRPPISPFMAQNREFLNSQERYRYLIDQLLLPRHESTQKILIFEYLELQLPFGHTVDHTINHTVDHTAPSQTNGASSCCYNIATTILLYEHGYESVMGMATGMMQ